MTRINYTEFYKTFAKKHQITYAQSDNLCDAVLTHLYENIKEYDCVSLSPLGTFKRKLRKAFETIDLKTKERITIPAKENVFFKLAKGDDEEGAD